MTSRRLPALWQVWILIFELLIWGDKTSLHKRGHWLCLSWIHLQWTSDGSPCVAKGLFNQMKPWDGQVPAPFPPIWYFLSVSSFNWYTTMMSVVTRILLWRLGVKGTCCNHLWDWGQCQPDGNSHQGSAETMRVKVPDRDYILASFILSFDKISRPNWPVYWPYLSVDRYNWNVR